MNEWVEICKTAIANAEAAEDPESCITFHHFPGYCECAFNREQRLAGRLARFVLAVFEDAKYGPDEQSVRHQETLARLWQESE
jgi:hypothetical protein